MKDAAKILWQKVGLPLLRVVAGLATLLYTLSRFIPGLAGTESQGELDDSWMAVLHWAWQSHAQFGSELVFTFGPWGFLASGYHPATYAVSALIWAGLAVVFWLAAWRVSRHFGDPEWAAWLWLLVFIAAASIPGESAFDVRVAAWALLLLALHFFVEEKSWTVLQIALVITGSLLGLSKFTGLLLLAVAVGIIALDDMLRHHRFPWIGPLFAGSVVAFWLAAHQDVTNLFPYLAKSWAVASGYSGAMLLSSATEGQDVIVYLSLALLLLGQFGWLGWKQRRWWGTIPLAGLAAVFFLCFKHGFVRHDEHEVAAVLELWLAALLGLAIAWHLWRKPIGQLSLVICLGVWVFASTIYTRHHAEATWVAQCARSLTLENVTGPLKLWRGTDSLKAAYESRQTEARRSRPLPQTAGRTDIYPWSQLALLAQNMDYRPRPVFQSYSAYTPRLAHLNADHLRSKRAAENIYFKVAAIDHRFPALDDGLSWPELWARYELVEFAGDFAWLRRSESPREIKMVALAEKTIGFGETMELPASTNGIIWAKIEVTPSTAGRLGALLYKPVPLQIEVLFRNGPALTFEFIPAMAREGFVLSPLVLNTKSFVALGSGVWPPELAAVQVTGFRIIGGRNGNDPAGFEAGVGVRIFEVK